MQKKKRKEGRRGDAGNGGNREATDEKDRMEERQKKEDTPVFTREFTPPFDFFHRLNGRIEWNRISRRTMKTNYR